MSNLCGCRVGVLAAGGSSDAVSLEDLLGVLQNGLVAELQVELERQSGEFLFNQRGVRADFKKIPRAILTFSCSMFFLCCLIFFTSRGRSGIPFPASSSCSAAYNRQKAPVRPTPELRGTGSSKVKKIRVPFHNSSRAEPRSRSCDSPAVHHDGRVQRPLVEVVSVDVLDEAQQVALAVGKPTEVRQQDNG